jgi:hypothetical protein
LYTAKLLDSHGELLSVTFDMDSGELTISAPDPPAAPKGTFKVDPGQTLKFKMEGHLSLFEHDVTFTQEE